jgi:hypothetical protein
LDQSARPALQFLAHEMLRLLEPSDSSRRARVAWTDEDSLGSPHAAAGSCLAQVALALNSLVRLDFLDLATFLSVSEYLRSVSPASLSAPVLPAVTAEGGGGGGNAEGSAGHAAGHGTKLTAHDVALLANAFSRVPDARWLAASSPSLARQARSSYLSRFLSRPSCFQSLSLSLAPTFLPPLLSLPPSLPSSVPPSLPPSIHPARSFSLRPSLPLPPSLPPPSPVPPSPHPPHSPHAPVQSRHERLRPLHQARTLTDARMSRKQAADLEGNLPEIFEHLGCLFLHITVPSSAGRGRNCPKLA